MAKYPAEMKELIGSAIRQKIYEAAIALIHAEGWESFTTERLAEKANVSRSVLYNYYKDKEDIVYSIVETSFDAVIAQLDATLALPLSADEKLAQMTAIVLKDTLEQAPMRCAFLRHHAPPSCEKKKKFPGPSRINTRFETLIEQGIESGEFTVPSRQAAVWMVTGCLHELCINAIGAKKSPEIKSVVAILLKGLHA